ncbi:MAG: hypothetical protein A2Z95_06110 [Gallionellales bacterium GWA2_60_18]|nr:MAG: hypothetical protein A2Z95_06110 [Gallionellales bacterium GWA2_60_18]
MWMDAILIFALGLIYGLAIGAWWANRRWVLCEKPVLNITVDKDVLSTVTQQMAMDWADRHGLTWQPKGAVYELGKGVQK